MKTQYWQVFYRLPGDPKPYVKRIDRIGSKEDITRFAQATLPDGVEIINAAHITDAERQKSLPADERGPLGAEGTPGQK